MNYWAKTRLLVDINQSVKYYQGQIQEVSKLVKSNSLYQTQNDYFVQLIKEYEEAIEQLIKHSNEVSKL